MKRLISAGLALLLSSLTYAQEFPVAWKSKFSFKPDRWFYDDDARYILGRSDDQAEVLDGATGKSIWKLNFKNDLKVKSLSRATYNVAEGVVLFFNSDEKKKVGEKIIVDLASGKELWRADNYSGVDADGNFHFANSFNEVTAKGVLLIFNDASKKFTGIEIKTGKIKWESTPYANVSLEKNVGITRVSDTEFAVVTLYDEDVLKTKFLYMNIVTGEFVDESKFTTAAGNQDKYFSGEVRSKRTVDNTVISLTGKMGKLGFGIDFELEASGAIVWKKKFEGKAVRQLFNDAPYVKLDIQSDKIFVMSKEITVFDLKTGDLLWSVPFDNCDVSVGLKAKQEFGIAGWPLVAGNFIYYVDLNADNAIKKVDGKTGKVVWQSEKLKSNDRVPNLVLSGGVLVAQFGGLINTQIYISSPNGVETFKTENRFDGNFELRAYDPQTGKRLWTTADAAAKLGDKFSSRISTVYSLNNKIVVASDKNLFCLEPKTGDVVYKTSLTDLKVGPMVELMVAPDFETLNIFCDNGVVSANASTGKINYATKTDEIFWKAPGSGSYLLNQGENLFIRVGEADFIGFDLATGKIKGKMKDNADPQMTADGSAILIRESDKVTKYAVNGN